MLTEYDSLQLVVIHNDRFQIRTVSQVDMCQLSFGSYQFLKFGKSTDVQRSKILSTSEIQRLEINKKFQAFCGLNIFYI